MYKYLLNDDMTKFAMMNDDEVICEANVVVEDDFAVLNFLDIRRSNDDSLFGVATKCCKEVKTLLENNGVNVSKVKIGGILAVAQYDEQLSEMDKRENVKVGKR